MKCPICIGGGGFHETVISYHDLYEPCCYCGGNGTIRFRSWLSYHLVMVLGRVAMFIERVLR